MITVINTGQSYNVTFTFKNNSATNIAKNVLATITVGTGLTLNSITSTIGASGPGSNEYTLGNVPPNVSEKIVANLTVDDQLGDLSIVVNLTLDNPDPDLVNNTITTDLIQSLNGILCSDFAMCVPTFTAKSLASDFVLDGLNTAATIVPDLSEIPVEAGKIYKIKVFGVAFNSNDLNQGFSLQLVEADGADGIWAGLGLGQLRSTSFTDITNKLVETDDVNRGLYTDTVDVLDQDVSLTIDASFVCTNSGTLDLWFGSGLGTAEVTLKAGATIFIDGYDPA